MIKAGSLAYAILICIVVGVFCYALIMMSGYTKMHQTMLFTHTELVANNESAQQYFIKEIEDLVEQEQVIDLFDNGIESKAIIKPWGLYNILTTESIFKKDTITQNLLIGEKKNDDLLALYLVDNYKPLYMVGKAKIQGNVYIPKKGIKPGYITSNAYSNTQFLSGSKRESTSRLPDIKLVSSSFVKEEEDRVEAEKLHDSVMNYREFSQNTLIVDINNITLTGKKLSGNIIIEAKDSIYIKKDNVLQDIIIKAPKVVFESGFKGNVQVFANQLVSLEEKVLLKYPSAICIQQGNSEKKAITIGENSKVIGALIIDDADKRTNKIITINENAEVIGEVFCSGKVALRGIVTGTVYTNNFYLKTEASIYDNHILDGKIDRKGLPDSFVAALLFDDKNGREKKYVAIKKI